MSKSRGTHRRLVAFAVAVMMFAGVLAAGPVGAVPPNLLILATPNSLPDGISFNGAI